jgi:hypothetical protein
MLIKHFTSQPCSAALGASAHHLITNRCIPGIIMQTAHLIVKPLLRSQVASHLDNTQIRVSYLLSAPRLIPHRVAIDGDVAQVVSAV